MSQVEIFNCPQCKVSRNFTITAMDNVTKLECDVCHYITYITAKIGGAGVGVTKLSELIIDVDKDWNNYKIKNLGVPIDANDALRKIELDNHVMNPSAHHTKTTSRNELTDMWSAPFWNNIPDKPSYFVAGSFRVLSSAPPNPSEGDCYYNSVDKKTYYWDGSVWKELCPTTVQQTIVSYDATTEDQTIVMEVNCSYETEIV
ncbi:MAG: hypothetical protein QXK24_02080 [Ignisphaera sp.]